MVILFTSTSTLALSFGEYSCKTELLQFYGLSGPEHSSEPVEYSRIKREAGFDACPNMEYSCCSASDFEISKQKWEEKADNIKRYLTNFFRIIQKTTVMQGTLMEMANSVKKRENKYCDKIAASFFQKAIPYSDIYAYLKNSIEAFAFMQKGFYCAICDAKNHEYLAVEDEHKPGVKNTIMGFNFCTNLIYYFREFIMFKVFYIDPMIINTNFLFNCYENTDKYHFNFNYSTTYNTIKDCVEHGTDCEYICKEFKMGKASDLFIGRLKDYHEFMNNLERIVTEKNPSLRGGFDDEITIDSEIYSEDFFANDDLDRNQEENNRIREFDASTFGIRIAEKGIDMFNIANHSNYYLESAAVGFRGKKHVRMPAMESDDDDESVFSSKNSFKSEMDESFGMSDEDRDKDEDKDKEDEWEEEHQAEKMEQDPDTPSKGELSSLIIERDNMEHDFAKAVNDRGTIDYEPGTNTSNFSAAAKVPDDGKTVLITHSFIVGLIMLMIY